ncbi:hypothetical protein L484_024931 [Morus notabilis]|uniref:Retrotransposon gag domain-containing protein n=1 Tax=Morus notabilis TaxID=981085 RepID=W9RBJ4_9ROSA|nr:hypothetical protein L484_024931 [Morus notabilis]
MKEQVGSLCSDIQRLGPMEQHLAMVMDKLSILDRVDKALQRLESPRVAGNPSSLEESSGVSRPGGASGDNGKTVMSSDKPDLEPGKADEFRESLIRGDLGLRRLEMPLFEGDNPEGWLFRVERYFSVNRLTEEDKLSAAAICFKGDALAWFQWEDGRNPVRSWLELKRKLLDRFRSSQEGTALDKFLAIQQKGTV